MILLLDFQILIVLLLIKENIPDKPWETPEENYHSIEIEIHVDIFVYKLQIWKSDFEWIE